jgi:hypothetical protein
MDVIEVVSLPRDLLALDVAAAMEQTDARKCESSPRTGATF